MSLYRRVRAEARCVLLGGHRKHVLLRDPSVQVLRRGGSDPSHRPTRTTMALRQWRVTARFIAGIAAL